MHVLIIRALQFDVSTRAADLGSWPNFLLPPCRKSIKGPVLNKISEPESSDQYTEFREVSMLCQAWVRLKDAAKQVQELWSQGVPCRDGRFL